MHSGHRPSSPPAPPQGAPGGSGQLGTPRVRPSHWPPSHRLGGATRAASHVADSTAFDPPGGALPHAAEAGGAGGREPRALLPRRLSGGRARRVPRLHYGSVRSLVLRLRRRRQRGVCKSARTLQCVHVHVHVCVCGACALRVCSAAASHYHAEGRHRVCAVCAPCVRRVCAVCAPCVHRACTVHAPCAHRATQAATTTPRRRHSSTRGVSRASLQV